MNPAEVVKQRMQVYNSPYKNCINCCLQIWRKEGLKAFYRSYATQLSMNVPAQSIHFMTYEFIQEQTNKTRTYNPAAHMVSGAAAGAVASAITTPLDVCKTLLNTQEVQGLNAAKQPHITGLFNAAIAIHNCCGYRGYFRGVSARILHSMPATAISWSVYEFFKFLISQRDQKVHQTHSLHETLTPVSKWEPASDLVVAKVPQT